MAQADKIPAQMTAVAITEPGGPLVLKPERRDVPEISSTQILIRVRAAGVNRPDVMQRKGLYPPPKGASDLPGLEVSGVVAAVGDEAKRWQVGDEVCALTNGGGYAEFVAVEDSNALPLPSGFTFSEAAALPETFFTVWHNVFQRGALQPGETLLVHGGSSGIGTAAIQIATALGSRVVATAGSEDKCKACLDLGAVKAINYRKEDFVPPTKRVTNGNGANVILDMIGGDYVARNYDAAAIDGRIVQIATQGGITGTADLAKLMMKRLVHTGSTLRPRTLEFKGQIAAELEARVWPLLRARKVAPVMDMIFPLKEAWRAHERMEEGEHIGKIVLDVG